MKKAVVIIGIIVIIIIALVIFVKGPLDHDNAYYIKDGRVYYSALLFGSRGEPKIVEGADPSSFKNRSSATGQEYGTDKNFVFCAGEKLGGSDGPTFKNTDPNYAFDKYQVYYPYCRIIIGADASSFQIISVGTYAKDKNHVYLFGKVIPISDPQSFEVLDGSTYLKDKNFVYYFLHTTDPVKGEVYDVKKIDGADSASFKVINDGLAEDSYHTYLNGKVK